MNTKTKTSIAICLLAGLLSVGLTACTGPGSQAGIYSATVVLQGQHTFAAGTDIPGGLFILAGEVELLPGSVVDGPVYLVSGKLTAGGQVNSDVSQLGGNLSVAPTAQIRGDLRSGNGEVDLSPQAVISGQALTGPASGVDVETIFPRRSIERDWLRLTVEAFLLAGAAYLAARFFPRPVERVRRAAWHHPLVSGAMGLLAGVVGLTFFVVIAFTLILIPVTLLGLLTGLLSIGFGFIAVGSGLGLRLSAWRKRRARPADSALGTFGFILGLNLLALLPLVGDWIYFLAVVTALGAVVLTRFGLREFVPEPEYYDDL